MNLRPFIPVAAAAFFCATTASANIGAVRPDPAIGGGLHSTSTELQVISEELSFSCDEEQGRPRCDFRAAYVLHNPTPAPQTAAAAFYGVHSSQVAILRDGASIVRSLPEELNAALDARAEMETSAELTRIGFDLTLASDETASVVVTGRLAPGELYVPSYSMPAVRVRHMLLGARASSMIFHLRYLISPIRTWGAHPATVAVTLTHPERWGMGGLDGTTSTRDGRRTVKLNVDVEKVDHLEVAFELPRPTLSNGGVLLGVGATTTGRLRVRAGYEIAGPDWLLWSVCGETDFQRDLAIIPLVQAASPSLLGVIPSVSAGLGVPVRLLDDQRVGLRGQATLHWPFGGLVFTVDGFPGAARNEIEVGLLVQLGL